MLFPEPRGHSSLRCPRSFSVRCRRTRHHGFCASMTLKLLVQLASLLAAGHLLSLPRVSRRHARLRPAEVPATFSDETPAPPGSLPCSAGGLPWPSPPRLALLAAAGCVCTLHKARRASTLAVTVLLPVPPLSTMTFRHRRGGRQTWPSPAHSPVDSVPNP